VIVRIGLSILASCLVLDSSVRGSTPASSVQTDLDAFMQQVLARRDENWKKLQQYILDERERFELRGPSQVPIWGQRSEFTWFIQEGYFVKSPIKVNGVTVPDDERRKAEAEYLNRVKSRDKAPERGGGTVQPIAEPAAGGVTAVRPDPEAPPKDLDAFLRQTRQPGFIDSAYFLRFKFEQGKYALVGREAFEGLDVLRIEYYPAQLFSDKPDDPPKPDAKPRTRREEDLESTIQRLMNKVSLVTLWVDPKSSQIVKYTFNNVNFDFLPAAWFVRVTDLRASMTMSQPFKEVWLPRDVDFYFEGMFAVGPFDGRYHIEYSDYRQATTSGRIKSPGAR
jgi:hypothetical protein